MLSLDVLCSASLILEIQACNAQATARARYHQLTPSKFGNRQVGLFVDVVQPVFEKRVLDWGNARSNIAACFDFVDWNTGKFSEMNLNIGDALWVITPALSFWSSSQTVFRLKNRYQWQVDLLKNPAVKTASCLFGFSTYS